MKKKALVLLMLFSVAMSCFACGKASVEETDSITETVSSDPVLSETDSSDVDATDSPATPNSSSSLPSQGSTQFSSDSSPETSNTPAPQLITMQIMTFNTYGTNESPESRYPYEIEIVKKNQPDIIGMQEVNNRVRANFIEKIGSNYATVYSFQKDGTTANYTPIVYRSDKLKVVDYGLTFLDARYTETNTKSIMYAVFDRIEDNRRFCVINLHGAIILESYGLAETNSVEGALWREDNVRQMLELMNTVRAKYGKIPVLFTGDFNFTKSSTAYQKAISAGLRDAEISALKSTMQGYKTTHDIGIAPASGNSIDHIFATNDIAFYTHRIIMDAAALKASDHCAVMAQFVLYNQ